MQLTLKVRIFVASPGDVTDERDRLAKAVDNLNRTLGKDKPVTIQLLRWEKDAIPGAGRPQAVITSTIGEYDILVGILWKRFGTPTGVAESGTEEEFNLAYDSNRAHGTPSILFYFSEVPYVIHSLDELAQLEKVLRFRDGILTKVSFYVYKTADEFGNEVQVHLHNTVVERYNTLRGLEATVNDFRQSDAIRRAAAEQLYGKKGG